MWRVSALFNQPQLKVRWRLGFTVVAQPDALLRSLALQSTLRRFCSTQPQPLPPDKYLEEVVELRVAKAVGHILRSEFSSLRTELRTDLASMNAKIESSGAALNAKVESSSSSLRTELRTDLASMNAKIESSGAALSSNFRQLMKDREVRICAATCFSSV